MARNPRPQRLFDFQQPPVDPAADRLINPSPQRRGSRLEPLAATLAATLAAKKTELIFDCLLAFGFSLEIIFHVLIAFFH